MKVWMLTGVSYVSIDDVSVLSNDFCDRQGDRICTCQETVNQRAVILSGTWLQTRTSVVEFLVHQVFCYDDCDQQERRHFYCDIVRTGSDFYRFNLTKHKNMNNFLLILELFEFDRFISVKVKKFKTILFPFSTRHIL